MPPDLINWGDSVNGFLSTDAWLIVFYKLRHSMFRRRLLSRSLLSSRDPRQPVVRVHGPNIVQTWQLFRSRSDFQSKPGSGSVDLDEDPVGVDSDACRSSSSGGCWVALLALQTSSTCGPCRSLRNLVDPSLSNQLVKHFRSFKHFALGDLISADAPRSIAT